MIRTYKRKVQGGNEERRHDQAVWSVVRRYVNLLVQRAFSMSRIQHQKTGWSLLKRRMLWESN